MGANGKCSWSKKEIALLVGAIIGFTAFFFAIPLGLRKSIHHHMNYRLVHDGQHQRGRDMRGRHDMRRPLDMRTLLREFDEVECEVLDIQEVPGEVECTRNERGEWCAARPPPPPGPVPQRRQRRDDHDHDRHERREEGRREHHERREGMRPEHHERRDGMGSEHHERNDEEDREGPLHREWRRGDRPPPRPTAVAGLEPLLEETPLRQPPPPQAGKRRRFPCMRMRVSLHNSERATSGMAHEDLTDANNFPDCSFSSCEENAGENRRRLEESRQRWEAMRHRVTICMVHKRNPSQVIILTPHLNVKGFLRSCGFHSTFWTFVFGSVCAVILCVLRCNKKKAEQKRVVPEKLPGGAYLVTNQTTEGMSEKEKEAFGLSTPDVANDLPTAPTKGFLMLAPPAYTEGVTARPITLLTSPPPYMITPASPDKEEPKKDLPLVE